MNRAVRRLALLLGLGPALWGCVGYIEHPDAVRGRGTPPPPGDFPIGLYHGLSGRHFGRDYSLEPIAAAGFDTVHMWRGGELAPALAEARRLGLRVLWDHPTDDEVAAHLGDPAILGWIIEEEPSNNVQPGEMAARREEFVRRHAELRRQDPSHPVLVVESAPPRKPWQADQWRRWMRLGDVSSHFNYPIVDRWLGVASLDTPRGIPASVTEAVAMAGGRPVWLVVQDFTSPRYGWTWPSPAQLGAMVWAGVIHGAEGIVFFSQDSFVTRDGAVVGVAPDPIADPGDIPDFDNDAAPALVAGPDDLEHSRRLWEETTRLVAALRRLRPALLSPAADLPYTVEVKGLSHSLTPIRTLLKDGPDGPVLLAVNLDDAALSVRFVPGRPLRPVETLAGPPFAAAAGAEGWEEVMEPFAIRAWRLGPAQ